MKLIKNNSDNMEAINKTFEIKDGKYTYQITNLKFDSEKEKLYGKIKLVGTKKQSKFYINFSSCNTDNFDVDSYKEDDDEDIYGVIDKFYSEHIEEKSLTVIENGNIILTKKIIFK